MSIEIVSVNAGSRRSKDVRRHRITVRKVYADTQGLRMRRHAVADESRASRALGNNSRTIYVYPAKHYAQWENWLDTELTPGAFGEHLTISGVCELNVCIGDTWKWGDAVFQVSHHGLPPRDLDRLYGAGLQRMMLELGLCGWHLQTVTNGAVPTNGSISSTRHRKGISVLESFRSAQKQASQLLFPTAQ